MWTHEITWERVRFHICPKCVYPHMCVLDVLLRALTRWRSVLLCVCVCVCGSGSCVGDPPVMYRISLARSTGVGWDSRPLAAHWGHRSILSTFSHPRPTGFIHKIHYLLAREGSSLYSVRRHLTACERQVRPWPLPLYQPSKALTPERWEVISLEWRSEEVMSFKMINVWKKKNKTTASK